jgi:uncharacterized phage protein (TIGR01671 family)
MAREIKFRAWDGNNMFYQNGAPEPDLCITFQGEVCSVNEDTSYGTWKFKLNDMKLMQYTGLHDKKGKEIYEGDLVTFGTRKYQIVHECGSFCLYDEDGEIISKIGGINDHCYSLFDLFLECCWEENSAYDIEVIGNIHENSKLLEK